MMDALNGTFVDCLAVVLPGRVADAVGTRIEGLMADWRENGSDPDSEVPPMIEPGNQTDERVWLVPATRRLMFRVRDGHTDVERCRDRYGQWYVDVPHDEDE